MVTNRNQHSSEKPARQAFKQVEPNPNKIMASTPFDFFGKNLTPYGGLLPVATMLEKLGFQSLVEQPGRYRESPGRCRCISSWWRSSWAFTLVLRG